MYEKYQLAVLLHLRRPEVTKRKSSEVTKVKSCEVAKTISFEVSSLNIPKCPNPKSGSIQENVLKCRQVLRHPSKAKLRAINLNGY